MIEYYILNNSGTKQIRRGGETKKIIIIFFTITISLSLFYFIEAEDIKSYERLYNIGKEKIEFRVAKSINYLKAMTEKARKEAAHDYYL